MSDTDFPEELNYATSEATNLAIVRAMGEIRFAERMRKLMPLIAEELVRAGVDFSKAKFDDTPQRGGAHES